MVPAQPNATAVTTPSPKRTWWRIALVALGAVILLLGGVYVALVRAFPPARLAALLAEQVQTATGREFRIGGALSLQLLPTIAVVARDVSLGNARWGTRPEMATVKRAAFELAVAPLLHGELHVLSIDVDGADVLLETNEQGHPNWVFAESAQRKPSSDVVGQPPAVRLDQLSLSDAHIAFRVGLTKVAHAIDIESLQVVNDGERNGVAARFAGRHRAWRLDATMGRYEALVLGQSDWPFDVQLSSDGAKLAATGSLDTRGTLRAKVSAQIDNAAALAPLLGDTTALPLP